ncbi:tripartite motif-containing protein 16-like [Amblyraja radiata]|uniref:tripartite motif-containing protein 16-like n=1 Tax=Amblyraja radiata TaxID=386614 RepID=UPI0014041D99|nr:tripartite motif-containing protein 16-like [Amblyraja radiata]
MATATVSLSRDSLACPICLDLLNEPVTLPCGHSFCRGCIGRHWEMQQSSGCSCPSCRRSFEPRPWLGTSTLLAQIVCGLAQGTPPPAAAGPGDVTCDSCPRQQPLKAERSCLQCLASYCQAHLQPHRQSPAFRHHRLAPPLRDLGLRRCPLHGKPLESYCRTERRCVCWVCALREHRDHQVSTVEEEAARRQKLIMERKKELEEHLQITANEIGKWIQNIDCIKESTQRVKGDALAKFSELIGAVQVAQREVLGFIERERQTELNRAERVRKELEQRWSELRQEKVRLEALSQIEDSIAISQEYLDFNDIAENPASPPLTTGLEAKLGKVERAVSGLSTLIKDHVQTAWTKNLENIGSADDEEPILSPSASISHEDPLLPEAQRREDLLQYRCQLTLDPSTVQKELYLSDGNQRVTNIYPRSEDYEHGPERFDLCSQVLCREPLGGGQFYWEVELNDGDAMIGITHGQIRRKGSDSCCILGRNLFSWCVEFWYNNVSAWHNNEETRLQVGRYGRIGVCLNCPAGTLTFYGVTEQVVIIHQFHATFNKPMHPAFWVYCDTTLGICQCP